MALVLQGVKISVAPTLLIEDMSHVWHDTNTFDYFELCHFFKILSVSTCQVFVSVLH